MLIPSTPTPPPPHPGPPGSWEHLVHDELRLRRMAYLLTQGMSYRAIAKELGVAYSTVLRMKPEVAELSTFTNVVGGEGR